MPFRGISIDDEGSIIYDRVLKVTMDSMFLYGMNGFTRQACL